MEFSWFFKSQLNRQNHTSTFSNPSNGSKSNSIPSIRELSQISGYNDLSEISKYIKELIQVFSIPDSNQLSNLENQCYLLISNLFLQELEAFIRIQKIYSNSSQSLFEFISLFCLTNHQINASFFQSVQTKSVKILQHSIDNQFSKFKEIQTKPIHKSYQSEEGRIRLDCYSHICVFLYQIILLNAYYLRPHEQSFNFEPLKHQVSLISKLLEKFQSIQCTSLSSDLSLLLNAHQECFTEDIFQLLFLFNGEESICQTIFAIVTQLSEINDSKKIIHRNIKIPLLPYFSPDADHSQLSIHLLKQCSENIINQFSDFRHLIESSGEIENSVIKQIPQIDQMSSQFDNFIQSNLSVFPSVISQSEIFRFNFSLFLQNVKFQLKNDFHLLQTEKNLFTFSKAFNMLLNIDRQLFVLELIETAPEIGTFLFILRRNINQLIQEKDKLQNLDIHQEWKPFLLSICSCYEILSDLILLISFSLKEYEQKTEGSNEISKSLNGEIFEQVKLSHTGTSVGSSMPDLGQQQGSKKLSHKHSTDGIWIDDNQKNSTSSNSPKRELSD